MAQNIYDDPAFFEGYQKFARSREGLSAAAEWPSLVSMMPDVAGLDVLDLGCGLGYHCRWAAENGARSVAGLDLSERMLAEAARNTAGVPVRLERADLETADFGEAQYDLAFSSLAVHYIVDFDDFCRRVRRALRPKGRFVFSTEHPMFAARGVPEFLTDSEGRQVSAVFEYLREGERRTDWVAKGVVKHHRKISTMIMALKRAGLELDAVDEWCPSDEYMAAHPDWAKYRYEPEFLLFATHAVASNGN